MMGGKAAGLARIDELVPGTVPPYRTMELAAIVEDWPSVQRAATLRLRDEHAPEPELSLDARMLDELVAATASWGAVAVRSSAAAEDGVDDAHAGMFETVLDVEPTRTALADAIERCARSMWSPRVAAYSARRGAAPQVDGAVIVQRMARGDRHGILFSETGDARMRIVWANAPGVAVGGDDASELLVDRIGPPPRDAGIRRLVEAAVVIERDSGRPVDVEFVLDRDRLALVQARVITTPTTLDAGAWDLTNIAENYPGVTSPLTYSFVRRLYAQVYPAFFRLIGTRERTLQQHAHVFQDTLGYVDGRVGYRIDSWFSMLALLPGGRHTRGFFEQMLRPVRGDAERARPSLAAMVGMAPSAVRLLWALGRADRLARRFDEEFLRTYEQADAVRWDALSARGALEALARMRRDLTARWAVPILGDVRVMIMHGLLERCFRSEERDRYLACLAGLTDRASVRPIVALAELGERLRAVGDLDAVLADADAVAQIVAYVREYGGRTPDELQLENPRIGDTLRSVAQLAIGGADVAPAATRDIVLPRSRARLIVPAIARATRSAIDWRERFRFRRAQIFGIARRAFLAVGARLVEEGALQEADDVFLLTEDELESIASAHALPIDLAALVELRRERLASLAERSMPRRVVGDGRVPAWHLVDDTPQGDDELRGLGVAPGRLTADAVVVREFDPSIDVRGRILVAPHADPGWTLLFVQAAGVVTERGNALSHVAIVARELGVPAVVAIDDATSRIPHGASITIDGTTGVIDVAA